MPLSFFLLSLLSHSLYSLFSLPSLSLSTLPFLFPHHLSFRSRLLPSPTSIHLIYGLQPLLSTVSALPSSLFSSLSLLSSPTLLSPRLCSIYSISSIYSRSCLSHLSLLLHHSFSSLCLSTPSVSCPLSPSHFLALVAFPKQHALHPHGNCPERSVFLSGVSLALDRSIRQHNEICDAAERRSSYHVLQHRKRQHVALRRFDVSLLFSTLQYCFLSCVWWRSRSAVACDGAE